MRFNNLRPGPRDHGSPLRAAILGSKARGATRVDRAHADKTVTALRDRYSRDTAFVNSTISGYVGRFIAAMKGGY